MRSSPPRSGVLHLITDPRRRGAQTFAYDLHEALRARGVGSEIVALAPHAGAGGAAGADGIGAAGPGTGSDAGPDTGPAVGPDTARLPVPTLGSGRLDRRTLAVLRDRARQTHVVVAHGSSTLPACAISLVFTRTPFIYVNIGDPRHWAASPARRLRVGAMLRRAAAVASVSPIGRDLLVARYGLPAATVRAIPNGRRPEAYPLVDDKSRTRAREELGIAEDAVVLAVVGALSPEKRVDIAVEGFARYVETADRAASAAASTTSDGTSDATADVTSDVTADTTSDAAGQHPQLPDAESLLLIAGDGTERGRLQRMAAERAPGRVRFLGTVDDAARVYRAADALLLTSDSEGVPGVLVEAGLSGIPAVATGVGFVRDVVLDGRTGALAAPGDPGAVAEAIGRVLADRGTMGAAAHRYCLDAFAMDSVVDAWQDLLRAVAGPAGVVDKA